ncbi:MAG: hypothetical protein V1906_02830 [Candidatus Woesearchaeota archaeon]
MKKPTHDIETSLTLDYRKSRWGIERIVLDSVSNHLPEDSNGSTIAVRLKQGGRYVGLKDVDKTMPIDEIVIEDDGSGYDSGLLSVLFSTKSADALSVGQFGEGLKLVAATALRNYVAVEYMSRDWAAVPYAKAETIDGHDISRLCFRVTETGDNIAGSRTVFHHPSSALVNEVLRLPEKVLAFNDNYRELHNERDNAIDMNFKLFSYQSRIIDLGVGKTSIFVKGVHVYDSKSIFSYDLGIDDVSPDRMVADKQIVLGNIRLLLEGCSNPEVVRRVLQEAHEHRGADYAEFEAFKDRGTQRRFLNSIHDNRHFYDVSQQDRGLKRLPVVDKEAVRRDLREIIDNFVNIQHQHKSVGNLWTKAFTELFGKDAVIASEMDRNNNHDAKLMGYNPVRLNMFIGFYLASLGVPTTDDIGNQMEYRWVEKSGLRKSEKDMLSRVGEINEAVLCEPKNVDVKVYSGLFTKSGRRVESSDGVYISSPLGNNFIGIKRSRLLRLEDFTETYIHELGHYITGADDFDRRFVDFFVLALARMSLHYLKK